MKLDDITASLPVTVPFDLHQAVADACGEPYAISYLTGAVVTGGVLRPRTSVARERLMENPKAMVVLREHSIHLGTALTKYEREPIPAVVEALKRYEKTGKFAA